MTNKTIIDGIDVSECKYKIQSSENFKTKPYCSILDKFCEDISFVCDKNCQIFEDFKQLARAKEKIEELKAQVDEWKENCNNNFELVAIRTKLLTDIAIKLGLNTAIIERKDVFDKIDKLQSKEQLSLNQSQVIITLRNNLNVNKQRNANLLQENEELKKQLDKYLNQEEEEIRQLNNDNKLDDILESIKKANEQLEKESKYKQALDEIEEFCTVYSGK